MIKVYSKDCKRIGHIESYSYLSWVRRYSCPGEFELKCTPENLPLLDIGNILTKGSDKEGAIIDTVIVESDVEEFVTVRGRFFSALLDRRIIWDTEILNGDIGSCMGQLIQNHAINPEDPERIIPGLAYENTVIGQTIRAQLRFKNLLDAVTGLCSEAGVGIKGEFKAQGIVLSLYLGKEQPFVFSRDFENVLSQTHTKSLRDYANIAKIAGEGEGAQRQITVVGAAAGRDRREIYVDARDLRLEEYLDEEEYIRALVLRGGEKLYEKRVRESFDAAANTRGNLKYREDFDLGDVVTVKSALLGISKRLRITEVIETYDKDGFYVDLVFGDPLPTLTERLKGVI